MIRLEQNIDIFGLMSSGLCALHCMALPVLMSFGILEGLSASSSHLVFEVCVLVVSFIIAGTSTYKGLSVHNEVVPYWFFGIGLAILSVGMLLSNHWVMGVGGISVAIGHMINFKLLHRNPPLC